MKLLVFWLIALLSPVVKMQNHIKHQEQLKLKLYHTNLIGYGHKLSRKELKLYKRGITREKAEYLFQSDYTKLYKETTRIYPFLSLARKQVVVALLYNMGYIPKTIHFQLKKNQNRIYLQKYSKSNGRRNKVLVKRRKFEENFWINE